MSMTFTKLFSSITESTIWAENTETRIVWITMLAMADRNGRVWASIPGLANRARVSVEAAEAAIKKFMEADKYSRTRDFEGKRIEEIDGGWRLLNYLKYRAIRDDETVKESKRKYINERRAKEADVENVDQCRVNEEAEAEAEGEEGKVECLNTNTLTLSPEDLLSRDAESIYAVYPRKQARAEGIAAIKKAIKIYGTEFLLVKTGQYALYCRKKSIERRFIPYPASWFNGKRWEDDLDDLNQTAGGQQDRYQNPSTLSLDQI